MPMSLKAKISKLRHKGKMTNAEYEELINKLEGHDKVLYDKAIDDFQEWLKTQIVGLDNTTNEILIAVDDRWELATDKFKECDKL